MWRTLATESQYSFYQMYQVNRERRHKQFLPGVGFKSTTICLTGQHLTAELSLLSNQEEIDAGDFNSESNDCNTIITLTLSDH